MVENIERIGFKTQQVALFDWELLGQSDVEAHLQTCTGHGATLLSIDGCPYSREARRASRNVQLSLGEFSFSMGAQKWAGDGLLRFLTRHQRTDCGAGDGC